MSARSPSPIALALVCAAAACGGGPTSAGGATDAGTVADAGTTATTVQPTLSDIQAKIFTPTCATSGCHSGSSVSSSGGLDLSAGNAYSNLVNVPSFEFPNIERVDPGSPTMSYLITKVTAPTDPAQLMQWEMEYDLPMPNGGTPLTQQQIDAMKTWIQNGAANN